MVGSVPGRRGGARPGLRFVLVGAALSFALAAGIWAIRTAGASVGARHAEGALPSLAMAFAFAAPGILALIGLAIDRPVLSCAAGFGCFPLVFVSIVAFPVVIPGTLFLLAFADAQATRRSLSIPAYVAIVLFPIPLVAGLWILITHTAQYTYALADGGSEGGDYFTPANAALCIALVAIDIVVVALIARATSGPPRGRPVSAPTSQSAYGS